MTEASAFQKLSAAVSQDSEYAWSIHCNLAMPIMDELKCTHEQANKAAARIMSHWFQMDMTKHPHWITMGWASESCGEVKL
jgi:hypothetical protein